jgi:ribonuclease HI
VYTDGACSNNGKRSAQAGYGVWFGEQDPRNISEPLSGSIQTNQRAEMQAMLAAFCAIARERNVSTAALSRHDRPPRLAVAIYSDSMYVLNGLQKWIKNWRGKWTNAAGKPVANKDLWMQLDAEHGALKSMPGVAVQLLHVKGHSGSVGNDGADALAVAGAERLRRRRRSSEATRAAAEADDVAGAEPPSKRPRTSAAPSATKKKRGFYAVANGHGGFCGVVGTWTECARLVLGVGGGTKHKKFSSASDAVAFVAAHGARPTLQESAAAAAAATAALSAGVGGGSADDPIELID